jgi:hypothetical protein
MKTMQEKYPAKKDLQERIADLLGQLGNCK